ncbi:GNAT family N-acetyltransferase [Paraburkholderia bannensis]|uniref:L-amino acid N-acyltransferase YncA n=3 Tax=Pseudomonadati TaxID=3379134 RepID=A0AAQ1GLB1_9BURK|nr:GNAT family N-acetyltransferase [Paraburkholderia bannensis]RQN35901.1 GNAT family N-acetyltransferase [Paraburkholderia tropica]SEK09569.1 L-amino acid N-acyltransferase YncA [Paraburkholderia tropica]
MRNADAHNDVALSMSTPANGSRIAALTSKLLLMLTIRPLTSESHSDCANVLRIFLEAPSYSELVEGRPPSEEDVDDFFNGKPTSKDTTDKLVFGFYVGPDMVGCADVIRSYPNDDCVWIGLLLFSGPHQSRGYGQTALALINEMARERGYRRLQLAAISTNPGALAFWQREGFETAYSTTNPRFIGNVIVMERPIR